MIGYDRTFPHHTNESEIWLQASSSGAMSGGGQSAPAPSKIVCIVSPFFCKAQCIPMNFLIIRGRDAGQKYVDMLIGRCHVFNNPHIPSGHTAAWRRGWIEAYGDDVNDAKNDDGTYGHGCTKYY